MHRNSEMDNSTPLLPNKNADADEESCNNNGLRLSQILHVLLISMACFFKGQQTFMSIFTDAKPSWHCTQEACNSQMINMCELPSDSWQWDSPARISIISDWSLQCSGSILSGFPASAFFMGCLLGGSILGFLGDSLGRKKMLFLATLTMSTASVLTAFSTNIWIYSGLRVVSGMGRGAIGSAVLVLSTESVGKEWRGSVGVVGFLFSALGYLSLPGIAYLVRGYSWRILYLLTSTPALFYCIFIHFCVHESPKWLQMEPVKEIPVELISDKVSIRKKLTLAMLVGFGIGLVYYGTPLGLGNVDFNIYLSVAFSAVLEIPSFLMTVYVVKLGRRSSLLALTSASGACGIACSLVVGEDLVWLQIGLQLTSFVISCTAFNLLVIYTAEIFQTGMRNSAVSMVWQALVLGGVISPLVTATMGEGTSKNLPHLFFSVVIIVLGSLVVLLKETVSDQNDMDRKFVV